MYEKYNVIILFKVYLKNYFMVKFSWLSEPQPLCKPKH